MNKIFIKGRFGKLTVICELPSKPIKGRRQPILSWHRYGGRGITVCRAWKNLDIFVTWALANSWQPGLELHRNNNDKGYSPSNCQWLTKKDHHQKHRRFIHEKLDVYVFLSLPA
jgi:hypothetical protein